jgi:radical SAM superfamily enzyme YgiQ (UPF0313 family)
LFRQWRDIGLTQVFVGMESFSDRRLEGLNKGITTKQQAQAVKILDELGILLYANFIVDPAFSREDFRELVRYVRMLDLKYASFSVLTPLLGTALYNERESELLTKRHEMFDFMHTVLPTTLPLKEFYAELAWLFGNALPVRHTFGILRKYGGMRALKLLIKYLFHCKAQKGIMNYGGIYDETVSQYDAGFWKRRSGCSTERYKRSLQSLPRLWYKSGNLYYHFRSKEDIIRGIRI